MAGAAAANAGRRIWLGTLNRTARLLALHKITNSNKGLGASPAATRLGFFGRPRRPLGAPLDTAKKQRRTLPRRGLDPSRFGPRAAGRQGHQPLALTLGAPGTRGEVVG
jgi:hypothetical protein